MKIVVYLSVWGGNSLDAVDSARVEFDAPFVARAVQLSTAVHNLGVYKVQLFDYRPVLMRDAVGENLLEDLEEADVRTECDCLNVTDDRIFWSGYTKHSDDHWETSSIPINDLMTLVDKGEDIELDLREHV